jgi:hypothetical protein
MPRLTKILTLSALWATLILSGTFAVSASWLRLVLLAVGAGVTIHLLRMPTYITGSDSASPAAGHISPRSPDET